MARTPRPFRRSTPAGPRCITAFLSGIVASMALSSVAACGLLADLQRFDDARLGTDGGSSNDIVSEEEDGEVAASAQTFCSSLEPSPKVCIDFDPAAFGTSWKTDVQGGTLEQAPNPDQPSSQSLRVVTEPLTKGQSSHQRKVFSVPSTTWTRLRMQLALYLDERDPNGKHDLYQLKIGEGQNFWAIDFKLENDRTYLIEIRPKADGTKSYVTHEAGPSIPTKTWVTLDIQVDLARDSRKRPTTAAVKVTIAGETVIDDETFNPTAPTDLAKVTEVVIGANYMEGPSSRTVSYLDDIALWYN